jgi:MinD superfamily P-loop ATPase
MSGAEKQPLTIAVASGKGGTGKTTVALNLAVSERRPAQLLDCDVEAPNCHLFLRPSLTGRIPVETLVPEVDPDRCDGCGVCAEFCAFNAIAALPNGARVFPELCHGCGGCVKLCPKNALTESPRAHGEVEVGEAREIPFAHGKLTVGAPMAPPVIEAVKSHAIRNATVYVDCPPGTSCAAVAAMRGCDYAILVTEPTPFGLNDLVLAVETARRIGVPFGVVINRAGSGDDGVAAYCGDEGIPILAELPDDRQVAEAYSRGELAVDAVPGYQERYAQLSEDARAAAMEGKRHAVA